MAKKYKDLFSKGSLIKDKGLMQHEQIRHQIQVLPVLEAFIPPLREEEFLQLEDNIVAEGCREALLVWDSPEGYILVDGHNRYRICQKHDLPFKITLLQFESEELVKEWMLDNQLGRRNLTSEQSSYLRGLRYELEKAKRGGYKQIESKGQNDPSTAEKLAKDFHVSEKTIKRDAQFALGLENIALYHPMLKHDILSGKAKINKALVRNAAAIDEQKLSALGAVENIEDLISLLEHKPAVSSKSFAFDHTKAQIKSILGRMKQGDEQAYVQLMDEVKKLRQYI